MKRRFKGVAVTLAAVAVIGSATAGFFEIAREVRDQASFDAAIEAFGPDSNNAKVLAILHPFYASGDLLAKIMAPPANDGQAPFPFDVEGVASRSDDGVVGGRGGDPGPPRVVFQSDVPYAGAGGGAVCFTDAPNAFVRSVILATKADAADLATLVDVTAPYSVETARIRVVQEGGALPEMTGMEASLTTQFAPGQWRVIALDFGGPLPLDALHFGDSAGRAEWQRAWGGAIAEAVCLDAPPGADILAGTANYLSLRWKFGGHPATPAQRKAAIAAGLNYGVDWATIISIR